MPFTLFVKKINSKHNRLKRWKEITGV